MLQCQSAAWSYLSLVSLRKRNVQACRNQLALQWVQRDGAVQICTQIHTGTLGRGIGRQLLMTAVHYLDFYHLSKRFVIYNVQR